MKAALAAVRQMQALEDLAALYQQLAADVAAIRAVLDAPAAPDAAPETGRDDSPARRPRKEE